MGNAFILVGSMLDERCNLSAFQVGRRAGGHDCGGSFCCLSLRMCRWPQASIPLSRLFESSWLDGSLMPPCISWNHHHKLEFEQPLLCICFSSGSLFCEVI